jgi:hypothetical protein
LKGFQEYTAEVHGSYNTFVTGQAIGRPPMFEDKLLHSVKNGGLRDFNERFTHEHPEVVHAE